MAESAAMPGIDDETEGCDSVGRVTPTRAAVEVAGHLGLVVEEPILMQETNNTVVWLRPHAIIAKVGTHPHSDELLAREHEVASALAALGAPVGPPLAGTGPMRHPATGFLVTLSFPKPVALIGTQMAWHLGDIRAWAAGNSWPARADTAWQDQLLSAN